MMQMFTDDSALGSAIIDPVDESSTLYDHPFKSKEYIVKLLSKKKFDVENFDPAALELELSQLLVEFSDHTSHLK